MTMLMRHAGMTFAVAAVLLLTALPVGAGNPVQAQIDAHLAAYPGGKQINATEVSYAGGTFVITFVRPAMSSLAADCPAGWFCFYDGLNYSYPRGKLASCGWQDLATWGWLDRTESAYYNMSSGSVDFINHGANPNHANDDVIFWVGVTKRGISDVYPYRNAADHVQRFC